MPATYAISPPRWGYTRRPLWTVAATNKVAATTRTNFIIEFSQALQAGFELEIFWLDKSIKLYVVAGAPGQYDIPPTSATPTEAEVRDVMDYLQRQELLAKYWIFTFSEVQGVYRITVNYHTNEAVQVSFISNMPFQHPPFTINNKQALYLEENLTCRLQVINRISQASIGGLAATYTGSYSPLDARAQFDISSAFNLKPTIPELAVNPFILERAIEMYQPYRVQIADRHGVPPATERMLPASADLVAIYGGPPLDSTYTLTPDDVRIQILHHYYATGRGPFLKPVDFDGIDYLFFIASEVISQFKLRVRAYYFDAAPAVFDVQAEVTLEKDEIYYVPAGPYQLGLSNIITNWSSVYRYDLELWDVSGEGERIALQGYHVNWVCRDWQLDLLYPNGVGGMEVMRATGKAKYETRRNGLISARMPMPDDNPERGHRGTSLIKGADAIEIEAGWADPHYMRHVAQAVYDDIWIRIGAHWVRHVIESDSIDITEDDEQISSIKFIAVKAIDQTAKVH
jgi:hypothetical protein